MSRFRSCVKGHGHDANGMLYMLGCVCFFLFSLVVMNVFIVLMHATDLTQGEAGISGIPKPGREDGWLDFANRLRMPILSTT